MGLKLLFIIYIVMYVNRIAAFVNDFYENFTNSVCFKWRDKFRDKFDDARLGSCIDRRLNREAWESVILCKIIQIINTTICG